MNNINELTYKEKLSWLRLTRSENVGLRTFYDLIKVYKTAEKALEAIPSLAKRGGRKKPINIVSVEQAELELSQCDKLNARIITFPEAEYPALLREIPTPPPVITVMGNTDLLNKKSIAIVGSRNASINGCKFANHIAAELSEKGYIVTSGLAKGIDGYAHKGAIQGGTIGVIAGGIDHIYPKQHADLYKEMAEKGAIIAELPIGSVPKGRNFPQRNRIISGISLGTLVVEAAYASGSLITARFALEQNREIFAVPGSPMDPRCRGTNQLIKNGAVLVESSDDIINSITNFELPEKDTLFESNKEYRGYSTSNKEPSDVLLESVRKEIISKLSSTPVNIDDLVTYTGISTNIVLTILIELELAGRLERHSGNKVSLLFTQENLELI